PLYTLSSSMAFTTMLNFTRRAFAGGRSKPPLGPLVLSRMPARASCCSTLAVNAFGEPVRSAISTRLIRRPLRLSMAMRMVARMAYWQALENMGAKVGGGWSVAGCQLSGWASVSHLQDRG